MRSLLSLGFTFCSTRPRPTNNINKSIERFEKDVRIFAFFKDRPLHERKEIQYIPTLNIKNDASGPYKARKVVEGALRDFEKEYIIRQRNYQKKLSLSNMTIRQSKTVDIVKDNTAYIVVEADKNLGGAALNRAVCNTKR